MISSLTSDDLQELFEAIRVEYGHEVFNVEELVEILQKCDYLESEARQILLKAMNCQAVGRVSRKKRHALPSKEAIIAIITCTSK